MQVQIKSKSNSMNNKITSKIFTRMELINIISKILIKLKGNGINEIEIAFGFAWGNNVNNWEYKKYNCADEP